MAAPRFPDSANVVEKDLEKGHQPAVSDLPSRSNSARSEPSTMTSNTTKTTSSLLRKKSTTSRRQPLVSDNEKEKKKDKMSWLQAATVMVAETISLGILSLPAAVKDIGLVPGSLMIVGFGLITTYTGYEVYRFKRRFPDVKSFAEAGQLIGGPVGRWIVEIMIMVFLVFIMAGHIIIFRSMAFKLSEGMEKPVCGVLWTLLALGINIACTMPRALKSNSWLSIFSCISIVAATFTAMGSVIQASHHHPVDAVAVAQLGVDGNTFAAATAAMSNILLSFTGHIAYFTIINEMHTPKDFPKALYLTNFVTVTLYALAGCVIYGFVGKDVLSPALDSASPTYAKVAYSLAIPTIIVAGVIAALVACKRTYDIAWHRRPDVTHEETPRALISWVAIVMILWTLAWVVGNVIPCFKSLLAVIGAAVGTWICLGFPAIFWFYGTWHKGTWDGWRPKLFIWINVVLFLMCVVASGLGLYGSILEIHGQSGVTRPFSCRAD